VVLIERVHGHESRSERHAIIAAALGEPGMRGFVEDGLGLRLEVPALGGEPGFEGRARGEPDAFQELALEPRDLDRLQPAAGPDREDVDERVRRELEDERVSGQDLGASEQAADLGEVPAKGPQRVVGVGEQEPGELLAGRRPTRENEVREEAQRLLPAGRWLGGAVDRDRRRPQQPDRQAHPGIVVAPGASHNPRLPQDELEAPIASRFRVTTSIVCCSSEVGLNSMSSVPAMKSGR
jgi:hypothetical protein